MCNAKRSGGAQRDGKKKTEEKSEGREESTWTRSTNSAKLGTKITHSIHIHMHLLVVCSHFSQRWVKEYIYLCVAWNHISYYDNNDANNNIKVIIGK